MTKHLSESRDRWAKEFKKRLGSTFDSFLEAEGIKEEVDARAEAALDESESPTANGKYLAPEGKRLRLK